MFFDLNGGDHRLSVEQQGFISVLNELHNGRDAGSSWSWAIDASGDFLVLIAITGLGLQLILTKQRRAALLWALAGTVLAVSLVWVAVAGRAGVPATSQAFLRLRSTFSQPWTGHLRSNERTICDLRHDTRHRQPASSFEA